MAKLKKYRVTIETRCLTTVIVESDSVAHAERLVMEGEYDEPIDVTHEDGEVVQSGEVD